MLISEDESYLEHYGKRGMRWGVRSAAKSSGTTSEKVKKTPEAKKATRDKVVKATLKVGGAATLAVLAKAGYQTVSVLQRLATPETKVNPETGMSYLEF